MDEYSSCDHQCYIVQIGVSYFEPKHVLGHRHRHIERGKKVSRTLLEHMPAISSVYIRMAMTVRTILYQVLIILGKMMIK
jgi:hypothetical protein